jgi:diguanylate cyclase (GGDEF)-like protein/PAS domain S-box-containing protein
MNVARKLQLIVFISVTIVALPSSALIYLFTKENILANEKLNLVAETQALIANHETRLNAVTPSLKALAEMLNRAFSVPSRVDELADFNRLVRKDADGAWRSGGGFDGTAETGIFLPPDIHLDNQKKRFYLRSKQVLDVFGNASKPFFTNVWLLTQAKSEVIYDQTVPDFVRLMAADNDYTQTPWMTLTSPDMNPDRSLRWTPLLFDPVPKSWMISAVYPLYVNGHWLGTVGHDIYLKTILPSLFNPAQRYAGEQHFLLDDKGQFILAGPWQQQLEANPPAFKMDAINETSAVEMLHTELNDQARIFTQRVTLKNREYIAVAIMMRPVGWRYFRLAPVDEVIAPIQALFFVLFGAIFMMALLMGILIEFVVSRNIVRRLWLLAEAVRQYSLGDFSVRTCLTGDDEISATAHDFNSMIDKIEQQRKVEIKLLQRNRMAIQCARDGIYVIDKNGILAEANPAFYAMLGYSPTDLLGHSVATWNKQWTHEELVTKIYDLLHYPNSLFETVHCCKDGTLLNVEITTVDIELDNQHYLWCSSRDITERKKADQHILQLAHFDTLTHLPNRSLLIQRVEFALAGAQRNNSQVAVIFLDLDHFKNINDTLGHAAGDDLLVQVSQRMSVTVREDDTVSRPGGDEFIIILPNTNANGAARVAEKLRCAMLQGYQIDQQELFVTASIGIAVYPNDGKNFEELSQCADVAMYRAKQEGRNTYRFFTAEMQLHSARILQLENALRRALELGQLQLHYQPQLSLQDEGRIIGVEALLRWNSDFGAISPAEFIPIAENSGQIIQIGEWVLRTAVAQLKTWLDQGMKPFVMAVNISSMQFCQANLPDLVLQILEEAQLPTRYLELELTESVAMRNPLAAIDIMANFHARGIRLAIDDFGTGYSSLSYLKLFKIHKLKIDQSFVRHLAENSEDQAIVSAVINLSHNLGFQTIAEGVETAEQLAYLQSQDCDEIQGYYFSRPLPAEQFEAFVLNQSKPCSANE